MRKRFKECVSHGNAQIPFQYYPGHIPEFFFTVPRHWHEEFELIHVLKGEGVLHLEGEEIPLSAGAICLVLPDRIHGIDGHLEYDALVFSGKLLSASQQERAYQSVLRPVLDPATWIEQPLLPDNPLYMQILPEVEAAFDAVRKDQALADLLLKSALLRLIYLLLAEKQIMLMDKPSLHMESFKPVLAYIQDHYQEKIDVATLAGLMHLSQSYFLHLFQKTFRTSPLDFVNSLRIQKACQMLGQSDANISEIVLNCGFSNLSNFNRQFRRKTGLSPREFRRNLDS